MSKIIFLGVILVSAVTYAALTEAKFLIANAFADIKQKVLPPPKNGSAEEQKDEAILFNLQKKRTPQDCTRANSELKVKFEKLFGEPNGPLTASELKALQALMTDVAADAKPFVSTLKSEYARQRPFAHIHGLNPCVPKEWTGSYPSWHATASALMALVAAEVIPKKSDELKMRGMQIGDDRVLGGVHHPTDIEAGQA